MSIQEQPLLAGGVNQRRRKQVPIQERSIVSGSFIVIDGYRANLASLKKRFAEGGYTVCETPHFLVFLRDEAPRVIVVHWFAPEAIHADITHYIASELRPFGIIQQVQHSGEIFAGIVSSVFPDDTRRAWRYFGANTFQRFLTFLATAVTPPLPDYATMGVFATLYQRVLELRVGQSFLDAGCAFGFLPLLVAERIPFVTQVVGVDLNAATFAIASELAVEKHLEQVRFVQADLLAEDFAQLGTFDTVVAIHVLEHFCESDMYQVLTHLLQVTAQRLLVAVPYEQGEPEVAHGHLQVFSRTKLEDVGRWCLEHLGGAGRMWYEECVGGLLLLERNG